MGEVAFVEVLDRRGRVRERVRLRELPASIGRGYDNDVIVEDRFVSPEHCRILRETTGEVVLEDLGSLNGILPHGGTGAVPRLGLESGQRFRIGETTLRYVEAGHLVAPTEPLVQETKGLLEPLRHRRIALAAVAFGVGGMVLDLRLEAYYESSLLGVVFGALAVLAVWAGAWAFTNRLLTHRFDFLRHLAWASLAMLAFVAASAVGDYLRFLFSADDFATAVDLAADGAAFGVLIAGHLAILPAATRRYRHLRSFAAGVVFGALIGVFLYAQDDSGETLPFRMPLKSLGAALAPEATMDDFLKESRSLKEAVDDLARAE